MVCDGFLCDMVRKNRRFTLRNVCFFTDEISWEQFCAYNAFSIVTACAFRPV